MVAAALMTAVALLLVVARLAAAAVQVKAVAMIGMEAAAVDATPTRVAASMEATGSAAQAQRAAHA